MPPLATVNHMVELSSPRLDRLFHALGQPTRRAMLAELSKGERTVGELAAQMLDLGYNRVGPLLDAASAESVSTNLDRGSVSIFLRCR